MTAARLLALLLAVLLAGPGAPVRAQQDGSGTAAALPPDTIVISETEITDSNAMRAIKLPAGKARIIRLPANVRDVLIADPEIADVVIKTPRLLYLIGRTVGSTNAFFFDPDGGEVLRLEISVELDTVAVKQAIVDLMPNTDVTVKAVNNNLFLTGTVRSPVLSENARQIALRFVEEETDVVNLLTVIEDQQVMLKVRISEVSRTTLKELGVDLLDSANGVATTFTAGKLSGSVSSTAGQTTTQFLSGTFSLVDGADNTLTTVINALERNGLIKTLAEPNLTAISGENANFLAGGEFPIPTAAQDGQIAIEFRPFGVTLNFTPVVLDSGRISLRISTEVSSLTTDGSITLTNITVPSLTVRRAQTTVELPSGGSLVIAGLLDDDIASQVQGIPGLKDLPVLGPLFRSQNFQRDESELVVAVTAYLVRAIREETIAEPTRGVIPPTDYDLYFLGRLHGTYAKPDSKVSPTALKGPVGYILE